MSNGITATTEKSIDWRRLRATGKQDNIQKGFMKHPKCSYKDCGREAVCGLALNVPAMNCPIAEHTPLQIVMGIALCDEHLEEEKKDVQHFFEPVDNESGCPLKEIFRMLAKGKADPDFDRAFVTRMEFDSKAWRALKDSGQIR